MEFALFQFSSKEKQIQIESGVLPHWKQVHGKTVIEVLGPDQECGNVDGLWTCVPRQKVAVVTADCVPILLMNRKLGAVAALHAGWRGTQQRIVESFFQSLPPEFSNPKEWSVLFGPSIRACCYEVSEELIAQFKSEFGDLNPSLIEPEHRKLDLLEVNIHQLQKLGVEELVVHPDCTCCAKSQNGDFKYFSYRRGDRDARQYSIIWLK
jgi:YfiH family protein